MAGVAERKMLVNPDLVMPSQDFLKPQTIRFIFECLAKGDIKSLPPAPIVREDETGKLVAIDGHNLLAVKAYVGEELEVHVAHTAGDGLPGTTNENKLRNAELLHKFDASLVERDRVQNEGIRSFGDLIHKYKDLFERNPDE